MVMQTAFLLGTPKTSMKVTPKLMEQKKNNYKICALLRGSINGDKETSSTKRRTGTKRST